MLKFKCSQIEKHLLWMNESSEKAILTVKQFYRKIILVLHFFFFL